MLGIDILLSDLDKNSDFFWVSSIATLCGWPSHRSENMNQLSGIEAEGIRVVGLQGGVPVPHVTPLHETQSYAELPCLKQLEKDDKVVTPGNKGIHPTCIEVKKTGMTVNTETFNYRFNLESQGLSCRNDTGPMSSCQGMNGGSQNYYRKNKRHVRFSKTLVSEVNYRPRTTSEEWPTLFYSCHEIQR